MKIDKNFLPAFNAKISVLDMIKEDLLESLAGNADAIENFRLYEAKASELSFILFEASNSQNSRTLIQNESLIKMQEKAQDYIEKLLFERDEMFIQMIQLSEENRILSDGFLNMSAAMGRSKVIN